MDEPNLTCITTYSLEMPAEMARMVLEANGIEAFISKDDCGGMRPYLQAVTGVRLMVRTSDGKTAAEILEQMGAAQHNDHK
ncbi:MAG: DUF2007 domain-containing protein [Verrucomicrobia bacterium]|nr:DUF2007 domain-containing protein [Verrucomicrobiota bacterium]